MGTNGNSKGPLKPTDDKMKMISLEEAQKYLKEWYANASKGDKSIPVDITPDNDKLLTELFGEYEGNVGTTAKVGTELTAEHIKKAAASLKSLDEWAKQMISKGDKYDNLPADEKVTVTVPKSSKFSDITTPAQASAFVKGYSDFEALSSEAVKIMDTPDTNVELTSTYSPPARLVVQRLGDDTSYTTGVGFRLLAEYLPSDAHTKKVSLSREPGNCMFAITELWAHDYHTQAFNPAEFDKYVTRVRRDVQFQLASCTGKLVPTQIKVMALDLDLTGVPVDTEKPVKLKKKVAKKLAAKAAEESKSE